MQGILIFMVVLTVALARSTEIGACKCKTGNPMNSNRFGITFCKIDELELTCEESQIYDVTGCEYKQPLCTCQIGTPSWSLSDNECVFYCAHEDMLLTCEQDHVLAETRCKNLSPPCVCKIGQPLWIAKSGYCLSNCKVGKQLLICAQAEDTETQTRPVIFDYI